MAKWEAGSSLYKANEVALEAKVVLLGDTGTGKTSLLYSYVEEADEDKRKNPHATIGASFATKRLVIKDVKLKMLIWDTAGQERFRSMAPMYYRDASAAILVYDITSESSFQAMKTWVKELNDSRSHPEELVLAIVGNKADQEAHRQVPFEVAQNYAMSIDSFAYETSAITNSGVEQLFLDVANRLLSVTDLSISSGDTETRGVTNQSSQRDTRRTLMEKRKTLKLTKEKQTPRKRFCVL